jgi:hypothetical protein
MAGIHIGGSTSLAFVKEGLTEEKGPQQFMPSNDKAYAEGRKANHDGAAENTNPFGADVGAAALINQVDAWNCWDRGWILWDVAGFQEETAYVDP